MRRAGLEHVVDEIERLKAKLTQDPKDARCQLYKATQKWQQEAERCNAEIERLRMRSWQVNCELIISRAEIKRLQAVVDAVKHYCYSGGTQVITIQRIIEQELPPWEDK
jgi:hypothetical protein